MKQLFSNLKRLGRQGWDQQAKVIKRQVPRQLRIALPLHQLSGLQNGWAPITPQRHSSGAGRTVASPDTSGSGRFLHNASRLKAPDNSGQMSTALKSIILHSAGRILWAYSLTRLFPDGISFSVQPPAPLPSPEISQAHSCCSTAHISKLQAPVNHIFLSM